MPTRSQEKEQKAANFSGSYKQLSTVETASQSRRDMKQELKGEARLKRSWYDTLRKLDVIQSAMKIQGRVYMGGWMAQLGCNFRKINLTDK